MKSNKILHPDAVETNGAAPSKTKKSPKSYDPKAAADIVTVSTKVNEKWAMNPDITLKWMAQTDFDALVSSLAKAVQQQGSDASLSPGETQSLQQMDKQMNDAVKNAKRGIDYKFKDAAVAQYARYGIAKENDSYQLPRDRDKRLENIPLMIAAVAADGFGAEDWGTDFWTTMLTTYTAAVKAAGKSKGSVSVGSGNIAGMVQQVNKASTALRFVLRGNYPDNYQQVYRDWGWQKESY